MLVSNVIVIICTVLMVGALLWVVISEHKDGDNDATDDSSENKSNDKEEEK